MRFSLKGWLPITVAGIALGVAATPISAHSSPCQLGPTAPVVPSNRNFTTNTGGFRLTPASPGFPVTTIAPGGSNLLLAPLYRAGINPFGNYGNYPLDYSPNGGYPFVYPGYPMYGYGYPGSSTLGTMNINVPGSTGSSYPSYGGGGAYPILTSNPYSSGGGYQQATLSTSGSSDGGGYAPYSNPYAPNYSPAGGFLQGAADLTTASANAQLTYNRAMLVNQQVGMKAIDYRRKLWDEARHERMMLPNSEQMRLTNIQTALDRARRDPPQSEIWSGLSLNDLFNYLVAQQGKGQKGPTIVLNEDVLKRVNLTTGKDGNVGLLKSDIKWPNSLLRSEFDEPRKNLDSMIPEAVRRRMVRSAKTRRRT